MSYEEEMKKIGIFYLEKEKIQGYYNSCVYVLKVLLF